MTIRRVALIFDDRLRPETTGVYCRRALGELVEVQHFHPEEIDAIPRTGFDLYLVIDDGRQYLLPPELRPRACWAIDTHMDFKWNLRRAREFDFVFAAQRDGSEQLRAAGIDGCQWLPLACDPQVHRLHDVENLYDVSFVGNLVQGERTQLVRIIQRYFPRHFVGRAYFDDMARVYSQSHVVFNRSIKNDINMRVFEALGCGRLLLSNDLADNGQEELVRDGVHLATYRDTEELLDKLRYYLQRPAVRQRIAEAGRQEAYEKHTYRQRMQTILETVAAGRTSCHVPRSTPAVGENSPTSVSETDGEHEGRPIRDRSYFHWPRHELLPLIPPSARRILEIGCGAGALGRGIKARQSAKVTGVEFDPVAACEAQRYLDHVLTADIEGTEVDFEPGAFDCVICADVLEHLRDPGAVLRRVHHWLAPDGHLIVSIPNVQHYTVVTGLLGGNWTYEAAGLLDRTHLQFFTRRDFERLLFASGFDTAKIAFTASPAYQQWQQAGQPSTLRLGELALEGIGPSQAEEFLAYQYQFVACPAPLQIHGLTSIVIVTHNELTFTQHCLRALQARTAMPYELIFVDNGSTDGTLEYLQTIPDATIIQNPANFGFPAAANQGVQASRGSQVVLLNNDVIVTSGWLRRMLSALYHDSRIGLVGPYTNCTAGPQRLGVSYTDPQDADDFAWQWSAARSGQVREVAAVMGFCLLIRREVIEQVGFLDEAFGIGLCEDVDYCRRAAERGFRSVIAEDAYVHHFGHATFHGAGLAFGPLQERNEQLLRSKWSATPVGVAAPS